MDFENFDFGPLWAQVATMQNLLVMLACGVAMEAFKRGPITRDFAERPIGQALQYYAPIGWCWLALFLPIGLGNPEASVGSKIMLGLLLAALTTTVYDCAVKAVRKILKPDEPGLPPIVQGRPLSRSLPEPHVQPPSSPGAQDLDLSEDVPLDEDK